jgi:toxin CcdB
LAQYDVWRATGVDGLLVDCQSDYLKHLKTRLTAPLLPKNDVPDPMPRLNPQFEIAGEEYVLATHLATAVSVRDLIQRVASLADQRETIDSAIDRLVFGV